MILGSNVFDAVVRSLEPDGALQAGGQRREPRVALHERLTILPCPEGVAAGFAPPLSVPVRDLSRGGVRILLPRRLPLDTQFVLLLPKPVGLLHAGESAGASGEVERVPTVTVPRAAADGSNQTDEVVALLCTVTYWQPLAKDLFAIGGQFIQALDTLQAPADAPRLVLPAQSHDAVEQRVAG